MHEHRALVLTDGEASVLRGEVRLGSREPRRGHEPDRLEPQCVEAFESAIDAVARSIVPEREELTLSIGPAQRTEFVAPPARQSHFVVPLAVKENLGALRRAGARPVRECRVGLNGGLSVPVGYHQQTGGHAVGRAQLPQCVHPRHQRGRHVVNREEERVQRGTTVRYRAKIRSNTDSQE